MAVLPVIGGLDSERLTQMQETLLGGIEQMRISLVLIDITGVPIIDTQVARAIVDAASAARLLGCAVTLVGIRPL